METWELTDEELRQAYWSVTPPFIEDEWQRERAVAKAAGDKARKDTVWKLSQAMAVD